LIDELRRELAAVGVRGKQRSRILTELADHLACDPEADLGDPRTLAVEFADELATDGARRTALQTFAALSVVAAMLVGTNVSLPTVPDIAGGRSVVAAGAAGVAMVVGAQIAFAAGSLAAIRAWRRRRIGALPAEEVALLRRRIAVAHAGGAATTVGVALYVVNFWSRVPQWWSLVSLGAAAAAALVLTAAATVFARAAGVHASAPGAAAGLSGDLGRVARPGLIGAAAALAMLVATAALERSLLEGALRAVFEAGVFSICFTVFRRPLALTR
jgi:hypothetical protein